MIIQTPHFVNLHNIVLLVIMANGETYNMDLLVHGEPASAMIMDSLEEEVDLIIKSKPGSTIREQRHDHAGDSTMRVRSHNYDDGRPNNLIVEITLEKQGQSSPKSYIIISSEDSGHIFFDDMNKLFEAKEIAQDLWSGYDSIDPEVSEIASYLMIGASDILNNPKMTHTTEKKIDNYEYLADLAMQLIRNEDRPLLTILSTTYTEKMPNGDIITIHKNEVVDGDMRLEDLENYPAYQIILMHSRDKAQYDYMKNMAGKRTLYVAGIEPVNREHLLDTSIVDMALSDLYDYTPRTHEVMVLLDGLKEIPS